MGTKILAAIHQGLCLKNHLNSRSNLLEHSLGSRGVVTLMFPSKCLLPLGLSFQFARVSPRVLSSTVWNQIWGVFIDNFGWKWKAKIILVTIWSCGLDLILEFLFFFIYDIILMTSLKGITHGTPNHSHGTNEGPTSLWKILVQSSTGQVQFPENWTIFWI